MKTIVLQGVFIEVGAERWRWSLTDEDGFTSYAEAKPSMRRRARVGDRFRVELDMDERGDILASRWEDEV